MLASASCWSRIATQQHRVKQATRLNPVPTYSLVLFLPIALHSTKISFLYLQAGGQGVDPRHVLYRSSLGQVGTS